jgi:glycerol-3-phosphate dehydrogenase (NAD(P)+)
MRDGRINQRYLPDVSLPAALEITTDQSLALAGSDAAILGVTVAGLRATLRAVAASANALPVIWLCKGFEAGSSKLPHQVAAEELREGVPRGVLSGPSFAQEVARGIPAAVTLAASDAPFAADMARELHSLRLRVYSSDDVIGVEVGGAVKNVIAIAAGISDGLGFGESARAALVTRGLAEITRLGTRLGGRPETFMGLSGVGDLILTCTGTLSRNRQVGLRLARGQALPDILRELGHVAEGVHSAREVRALARSASAEMPIAFAVCGVLYEGLAPLVAVDQLLSRDPKPERT